MSNPGPSKVFREFYNYNYGFFPYKKNWGFLDALFVRGETRITEIKRT